jgi:hypothetical protein
MSNPALLQKGSLWVGFDGGSAPIELRKGVNGQCLIVDDTEPSGLRYADSPGDGVSGPDTSTDNALPRYDGAGGHTLQNSNVTLSDTDVMTFPAGGGNVYTAGARKGSFTLSSGTHTKITTTAALADSVIQFTIATLGTVTVPKAMLCTIDPGVGFTPVSADATDTSTINWAILA